MNVLFFANINPLYQDAFQGLFLVVAVVLGALVGRLVGVREMSAQRRRRGRAGCGSCRRP